MRLILNYVLAEDGKTPVAEPDIYKWGAFFDDAAKRIVAKTTVGNCEVSTVFLGLDHNFAGTGDPVLWETMVFGGAMDQYQLRYRSYDDALASHNNLCDFLRHLVGNTEEQAVVESKPIQLYKKLARAIAIHGKVD